MKESQAPLDALLDAAVDGIILINRAGIVLRFNPAAQSMFGYSDKEVIGNSVNMLMPEPYRHEHDGYMQHYHDTREAAIIGIGREVRGLHKDGSEFPIHLSVGEISGDRNANYVGILRDLRAEKQAQQTVRELEQHLAHADRLVTLGELTAGIAHEINQPLTAIAAYSDAGANILDAAIQQRAELEADSGSELANICRRISEQARRAGEVVRRLQGLSRRGQVDKVDHDINEIVRNILLLIDYEIKRSNITVLFHLQEDLPVLFVDGIQIQQVLVNLVKNSIDALGEAGTEEASIRLITRLVNPGPSGDSHQGVEVVIEDNGPGVPAEVIPRLFEPFFTTKDAGVGLGLSLCKNIATAHGGRLYHEAPQENGSRFILYLPLERIG